MTSPFASLACIVLATHASRGDAPTESSSTPPPLAELPVEPVPGLDPIPGLEPVPGLDSPAQANAQSPPVSSPAGSVAPSSSPAFPSASEVLSGSARMTAAYLHLDDDNPFGMEDDALSTLVIRGIANAPVRPWLAMELNYFVELGRVPGFGGGDGTFTTAATAQSAYRSPLLTWSGWSQGTVRGAIGVDRFVLRMERGDARLSVGRFPITLTTSTLITPNDFFAPFGATAVNRIYKPGVDGARFEYALRPFLTLDVMGVLGNDEQGDPTWTDSALLASLNLVAGGYEIRVVGGKVSRMWIAGASIQGSAGPVHLHAEGHVSARDQDSNGRLDAKPWGGKLAAGPSLSWPWKNLSVGVEYAYLSDGGATPADYLEVQADRAPDALPYLGRHYLSSFVGADLIPVLNLSAIGLFNVEDGSGLSGVSLKYNAADEVDILLGAFAPWGAPSSTPDPLTPSFVQVGSEFGDAPLTVYVETRAFF